MHIRTLFAQSVILVSGLTAVAPAFGVVDPKLPIRIREAIQSFQVSQVSCDQVLYGPRVYPQADVDFCLQQRAEEERDRERQRIQQEEQERERLRIQQEEREREQLRIQQQEQVRERLRIQQQERERDQLRIQQQEQVREQQRIQQQTREKDQLRIQQQEQVREQQRIQQQERERNQLRIQQERQERERQTTAGGLLLLILVGTLALVVLRQSFRRSIVKSTPPHVQAEADLTVSLRDTYSLPTAKIIISAAETKSGSTRIISLTPHSDPGSQIIVLSSSKNTA